MAVLSGASEARLRKTNTVVSQLSFEQPNNDAPGSFNFMPSETSGLKGREEKVLSKPNVWPSITRGNEGGVGKRSSRICLALGNPVEKVGKYRLRSPLKVQRPVP